MQTGTATVVTLDARCVCCRVLPNVVHSGNMMTSVGGIHKIGMSTCIVLVCAGLLTVRIA